MTERGRRKRPLWRTAVDRIDGIVTPAATGMVRTNVFADMTAAGIRMEGQVRRRLERQLSAWWHLLNLPTAADQRSMRAQLTAIEARVRDLSDQLEALGESPPNSGTG